MSQTAPPTTIEEKLARAPRVPGAPEPRLERAVDLNVLGDVCDIRYPRPSRVPRKQRFLLCAYVAGDNNAGAVRGLRPFQALLAPMLACESENEAMQYVQSIPEPLRHALDLVLLTMREFTLLDNRKLLATDTPENIGVGQQALREVWQGIKQQRNAERSEFEERVLRQSKLTWEQRGEQWGSYICTPCAHLVDDRVGDQTFRRPCGIAYEDHDTISVLPAVAGGHLFTPRVYHCAAWVSPQPGDRHEQRRICGVPIHVHDPEALGHEFTCSDLQFSRDRYLELEPVSRLDLEMLVRGLRTPRRASDMFQQPRRIQVDVAPAAENTTATTATANDDGDDDETEAAGVGDAD